MSTINFILHYYYQNNLNYLWRNLYFTTCEYNIIVSSKFELKSLINNLCSKNQIMNKLYYQKKKIGVDMLSESLCMLLQPRTVVYNIYYYVSDRSPCVALTQFPVWWFHIRLHSIMFIYTVSIRFSPQRYLPLPLHYTYNESTVIVV